MSDQNNSSRSNSSLGSLITGIVIGAAVTYLFGTKNGKKVRHQLIQEGQKLLDKMGEGLEEVKEKTEESEAVQKIEEKVEEVPQHIAEIQKKGRRFFFHRRSHSES